MYRAAIGLHGGEAIRRVEALLACAALALLAGCGGGGPATPKLRGPSTIRLTSPDFHNGGRLPRALTCDGAGRSPALRWSGVPVRTRELALIVDDPDAPGGDFHHWTLWRLSAKRRSIPAGHAPSGSRTTANGAGRQGWTPPCPPSGTHRYVFTLVALTQPLADAGGAPVGRVRADIARSALASGRLIGRYGR